MKKVLVTGSAGFLGKYVADFLCQKKCKVYPFDKISGQDLLKKKDLKKALPKVEYVCHLAAVGDVYLAAKNPTLAARIGVEGTANLFQIANNFPIKKIVYASTWEVYGQPQYQPLDEKHPCHPNHPYTIAKYAGELILQNKLSQTPWVILRLGSAYGKKMRKSAVIAKFIQLTQENQPIIIHGNGSQIRQFTHAKDIANAFYLAIKKNVKNEVFNIVSSEVISIRDILNFLKKHYPVKVRYCPKRKGEIEPAQVSHKKAQKILSWEAKIKFADGFNELIGRMKVNHE